MGAAAPTADFVTASTARPTKPVAAKADLNILEIRTVLRRKRSPFRG